MSKLNLDYANDAIMTLYFSAFRTYRIFSLSIRSNMCYREGDNRIIRYIVALYNPSFMLDLRMH